MLNIAVCFWLKRSAVSNSATRFSTSSISQSQVKEKTKEGPNLASNNDWKLWQIWREQQMVLLQDYAITDGVAFCEYLATNEVVPLLGSKHTLINIRYKSYLVCHKFKKDGSIIYGRVACLLQPRRHTDNGPYGCESLGTVYFAASFAYVVAVMSSLLCAWT